MEGLLCTKQAASKKKMVDGCSLGGCLLDILAAELTDPIKAAGAGRTGRKIHPLGREGLSASHSAVPTVINLGDPITWCLMCLPKALS